jgi:hypothetical protein
LLLSSGPNAAHPQFLLLFPSFGPFAKELALPSAPFGPYQKVASFQTHNAEKIRGCRALENEAPSGPLLCFWDLPILLVGPAHPQKIGLKIGLIQKVSSSLKAASPRRSAANATNVEGPKDLDEGISANFKRKMLPPNWMGKHTGGAT